MRDIGNGDRYENTEGTVPVGQETYEGSNRVIVINQPPGTRRPGAFTIGVHQMDGWHAERGSIEAGFSSPPMSETAPEKSGIPRWLLFAGGAVALYLVMR